MTKEDIEETLKKLSLSLDERIEKRLCVRCQGFCKTLIYLKDSFVDKHNDHEERHPMQDLFDLSKEQMNAILKIMETFGFIRLKRLANKTEIYPDNIDLFKKYYKKAYSVITGTDGDAKEVVKRVVEKERVKEAVEDGKGSK